VDNSTLCTLPYVAATTPIADGLHRLHAPSKMEVIPGGQPDTTGGKLSIDTLDSTPPSRRGPQGTVIATQDEVRNEERVTPHNASVRKQRNV